MRCILTFLGVYLGLWELRCWSKPSVNFVEPLPNITKLINLLEEAGHHPFHPITFLRFTCIKQDGCKDGLAIFRYADYPSSHNYKQWGVLAEHTLTKRSSETITRLVRLKINKVGARVGTAWADWSRMHGHGEGRHANPRSNGTLLHSRETLWEVLPAPGEDCDKVFVGVCQGNLIGLHAPVGTLGGLKRMLRGLHRGHRKHVSDCPMRMMWRVHFVSHARIVLR